MKANSMRVLSLALACLANVCAAQSSGQPAMDGVQVKSQTVFHMNTHLAVTDVVVTDRHGMLIHGLTANDFHVFENGVEQKISSFEEHTGRPGPTRAPIAAVLPPDTYSNTMISKNTDPLYVILLDSLNTVMSDQSFAQEELLALAKSLPRGSRVAVFRLGSKLSMLQGFTEDAAELEATVRTKASPQLGMFFDDPNLNLALNFPDITAGMGSSSMGGVSTTFVQHTLSLDDANEAGIRSDITISATIRALKTLGYYLSGFSGRKNLVWLSGTFPLDIIPNTAGQAFESSSLSGSFDPFRGNRTYTLAIHDLALLLQSANIAVYPVDARGLPDSPTFNAAAASSGRMSADVQTAAQSIISFAGSNGQNQAIMQTIAKVTGGRAYYNTNDLKGSMMEAFNDGSNFYSISYVPSNQKWDGGFRKIRIQVERPHIKSYYREGYYAEEPDKLKHSYPSPDDSMRTAMLRGSPTVSEIAFEAQVKPVGGAREVHASEPALRTRTDKAKPNLTGPVVHYSVQYTIRPEEIQFLSTQQDLYRGNLALVMIGFDADGKMLNSVVARFDAPLRKETYEAMQRDAVHIRTGIDLPPGKVYLRLGVHDLASDKIGALEIPLDVTAAAKPAN